MIINATAKLKYWEGGSIFSGGERLELNVTFKEDGKRTKTRLTKGILSPGSMMYIDGTSWSNLTPYYDAVKKHISNIELIKKDAEELIRDYFEREQRKAKKNKIKEDIVNKVNGMPEVKIKLEIK